MEIEITGPFIKVSQLLKKLGKAPTGGTAKFFLKIHKVLINGEEAIGRNSKIKIGDTIWIDYNIYKIVEKKEI